MLMSLLSGTITIAVIESKGYNSMDQGFCCKWGEKFTNPADFTKLKKYPGLKTTEMWGFREWVSLKTTPRFLADDEGALVSLPVWKVGVDSLVCFLECR